MTLAPRLAADREPVPIGQPQVEDNRVRAVARDRDQHVVASGDTEHVVAGLVQLDLEHAADRVVVLDDEDALAAVGHV